MDEDFPEQDEPELQPHTHILDGAEVRLLLRMLFTPHHLPFGSLRGAKSARNGARQEDADSSATGDCDVGKPMRMPSARMQPLIHGEVWVSASTEVHRGASTAAEARSDGVRGPYDRAGEPWSGLTLRTQPSAKTRAAIGFRILREDDPSARALTPASSVVTPPVSGDASATHPLPPAPLTV